MAVVASELTMMDHHHWCAQGISRSRFLLDEIASGVRASSFGLRRGNLPYVTCREPTASGSQDTGGHTDHDNGLLTAICAISRHVNKKELRDHAGFILALGVAVMTGAGVLGLIGAAQVSGTKRSFASDAWGRASIWLLIVGLLLVLASITLYVWRHSASDAVNPLSDNPPITYPGREFTDATPSEIMRNFHNNTEIQARKLTEPLIGKWLRVSGRLDDVGHPIAGTSSSLVTLKGWNYIDSGSNCVGIHFWFSDTEVVNGRLSVLPRDTAMTIIGQIEEIIPHYINLIDCEIESAVTPNSVGHAKQ